MFRLLALAVSAMLNIMALALALLLDSISTKFFLAMVNGLMGCSEAYANTRIICIIRRNYLSAFNDWT